MKSKILDRPMFKKPVDETDVENVGIMQGFMDEEADDDLDYGKYMQEEEGDDDESDMANVMDRRPNSPEILMNNLRGDMRSVDARVEELADLVGYNAAADTPPEVLALLQPVLAQGIGSMPAEQALGQPMPPAPPAPQGGMPPAPPGGMTPPMAMPPGPPPAAQGPGAPVAMANGGYVQRFSDGTDEDGVTPMNETSSFAGLFPPETVDLARRQVLASLGKKPMAVPDLAAEVDKRAPLYEKILGVDSKQTQAQILFELGNRAFNYAANVDDQGNRLRGSQAARLAGAIRTLPGAIGGITSQIEQQKRAVKTAALQATEKDVQAIREQNTKLVATQTKLWQEIAKTTKDKALKPELELLAKYAPEYAAGTLSPLMDRKFEAAYSVISQPTQFTDEYGRLKLREPVIPKFLTSAFETREGLAKLTPKVKAPGVDSAMPERSAVSVAESGSDDRAKQEDIARRFKTAKSQFEAGTMPKAVYDDLVGTLNEESKQVKASIGETTPVKDKTAPKETSLWGIATDFTGPYASLRSGFSSIPSLGGTSPEVTRARSYASSAINQIVAALGTTARFGNTEREQIKSELGLTPSAFQDPRKFMERLVGLDDLLTQEIDNANRVIKDPTVPVELQKQAEKSFADLNSARKFLSIPRVSSEEEGRRYPVGSFVLYNGKILERKLKEQ